MMKCRVAVARAIILDALKDAIRRVWVQEITQELCKNMRDLLPCESLMF